MNGIYAAGPIPPPLKVGEYVGGWDEAISNDGAGPGAPGLPG